MSNIQWDLVAICVAVTATMAFGGSCTMLRDHYDHTQAMAVIEIQAAKETKGEGE